MARIISVETVSQYNQLRGITTVHPLATVVDTTKAGLLPTGTYQFGLYGIFLKEQKCGELRYGRKTYDYQDGTLVYMAPGQVLGVEYAKDYTPRGWTLIFHPDLIKGTSLGRNINKYSFFSYDVNEALHISDKEREIVADQFRKIRFELEQTIDKHSKTIICSGIELLLNYSTRFYDRQFFTRDHENKGVIERFEELLHAYFASDRPREEGLPTVASMARELNLSPNYFGDLIKKETGLSPSDHIQSKVIDVAKEKLFDTHKSIAEVGYELGFKYPQHFTRLFKLKAGVAPNEYRNLN